MSVLYNNIEETAIRTGEARTRLPFQSHNDCQIVEEDYVQKASAFTHITRLSQSANGGAEAVLDGGGNRREHHGGWQWLQHRAGGHGEW